jgi:flagellar hook assembly protein FlgD
LQIFDINGQLIQTIINKELLKGEHKFIWNRTDRAGIYLVILKTVGKTIYQTKIIKKKNETIKKY